jgi:tetratricopeptide (TPR) repeat protein
LAFSYLQQAFALKNDDPAFQLKLAQQLQHLAETHHDILKDQQKNIQELWIGLAQTAFKNRITDQARSYLDKALQAAPSHREGRLQVGRVYLLNQQYQLAQPFLADLQQAFPHDLRLQVEIGHAYWSDAKLDKAVAIYEMVLTSDQKLPHSSNLTDKQIAFLSNRVGVDYFDNSISNDASNLAKSIPYLAQAVKKDSTELSYQRKLCQAYIQQWETSAGNFVATYAQDWLQFLSFFESSVIQAAAGKIKKILLSCSDQFFQVHQNQKAHSCLKKILELFPHHVEIKIAALDLAIRHRDWAPLEPLFDQWKKENYANPYLKKTMGDAYWDKNKSLALKLYQEALDLFTNHLTHCQEEEKKTCQNQMAEIHLKIGKDHLSAQPGFWKSVPYDEAIQRLEKAANLNPELYASALFDAYLRAAQAEKERATLLQDAKKIIAYYQKAFQTLLQKGEYLIELMQLCLSKQPDDAISLYYEIQKQPWAKELVLPAKVWSELAQKFHERKEKDHEATLACLKQAYKQEPTNKKYKEDYFQFSLTLAQDGYKKSMKDIESLSKIAQMLTDCVNEGFVNVEKFKPGFEDTLVKVYGSLAECHVQRCWLPLPASEYDSKSEFDREKIKQHKQQHRQDIQAALNHYTKALSYQPQNAALHFDKGLLLDWNDELEEALKEFELAIKYQPRNPFYHKMYGLLLYAVRASSDGHMEIADECAPPHFAEDYPIWKDEYMCRKKTKSINPHDYTTKESWFPLFN